MVFCILIDKHLRMLPVNSKFRKITVPRLNRNVMSHYNRILTNSYELINSRLCSSIVVVVRREVI